MVKIKGHIIDIFPLDIVNGITKRVIWVRDGLKNTLEVEVVGSNIKLVDELSIGDIVEVSVSVLGEMHHQNGVTFVNNILSCINLIKIPNDDTKTTACN